MSSPKNKKKRNKPLLNPSTLFPLTTANLSLPDDLLLSCIARLSRLYYPTLSLVSKSYRSLLASPELYKTRSLLNRTESCLYVCLRFSPDCNPRWFTLSRRPNRTLGRNNKFSNYLLVPVTSPHATSVRSSLVAVGSDIYEIGGLINGVPSSSVSVLDCRSNLWHQAPNMKVGRTFPSAEVIDGKILVKGGLELKDVNSAKWVESQYDNGMASHSSSFCLVDDVSYSFDHGKLKWFDAKVGDWRFITGLEGLPKFLLGCRTSWHVHLADYGGKMVILWDRHDRSSNCQGRTIWCAVISLERCSSEEISGTLEWSDAVLKVPKSFEFVHVLAVTV
ncbi:F-box/kelch-repeat protein [Raphanus sativus]|nr:F-box/kelch-repeat protein [Raphanus sativus]